MTVVCAWCQKHLGEKFPDQPGVSHGICEECKSKVLSEAGRAAGVSQPALTSNRRQGCGACGGSGLVRTPDNQGSDWEGDCPVCDGTGWVADIDLVESSR